MKTLANDCENIAEFLIEVPAIQDTMVSVNQFMCENGTLIYLDKEYYKSGVYYDTLRRTTGCDSVIEINIDYIKPVEEYSYDTITNNNLPYLFYEQECLSTGEYTHTIFSQGGCDSVVYHLNLQVYDELEIELSELSEICGDDSYFAIPYTIHKGSFSKSKLSFAPFAQKEGFVNIEQWRNDDAEEIVVSLPDSVRPDVYNVDVNFYGYGGDTIIIPLEFMVLYPSSIIGQRWNDFLSVKNAQYNGGYTFTDCQWYLNGSQIEGYKMTQIYREGEKLDFNGEYRVLLTRADDGKAILSCPFTPIEFSESEYTELNTLVYSDQIVVANASHSAKVDLYNVSGVKVASYNFVEGNNDVKMPSQNGVYTMQIVYSNGSMQIIRIVVR